MRRDDIVGDDSVLFILRYAIGTIIAGDWKIMWQLLINIFYNLMHVTLKGNWTWKSYASIPFLFLRAISIRSRPLLIFSRVIRDIIRDIPLRARARALNRRVLHEKYPSTEKHFFRKEKQIFSRINSFPGKMDTAIGFLLLKALSKQARTLRRWKQRYIWRSGGNSLSDSEK